MKLLLASRVANDESRRGRAWRISRAGAALLVHAGSINALLAVMVVLSPVNLECQSDSALCAAWLTSAGSGVML